MGARHLPPGVAAVARSEHPERAAALVSHLRRRSAGSRIVQGHTSDQVAALRASGYRPQAFIERDEELRRVLDTLAKAYRDEERWNRRSILDVAGIAPFLQRAADQPGGAARGLEGLREGEVNLEPDGSGEVGGPGQRIREHVEPVPCLLGRRGPRPRPRDAGLLRSS
jgi:hypothetical protein